MFFNKPSKSWWNKHSLIGRYLEYPVDPCKDCWILTICCLAVHIFEKDIKISCKRTHACTFYGREEIVSSIFRNAENSWSTKSFRSRVWSLQIPAIKRSYFFQDVYCYIWYEFRNLTGALTHFYGQEWCK